jgi:hypothetical protein
MLQYKQLRLITEILSGGHFCICAPQRKRRKKIPVAQWRPGFVNNKYG